MMNIIPLTVKIIPLTLIPLVVYNIVTLGWSGTIPDEIWARPVFTVEMVSGAQWTMVIGDLMITVGIVCLFAELGKATRIGRLVALDHVLSILAFMVYLIEFLAVRQAAHSVFFILLIISLVDVIAGFLISLSAARRDIAFTPDQM